MPVELKYMSGEEFIRKILEGERYFSGITLEEGFDLSGHEAFEEMQKYLKGQNLHEEHVLVNYSEFKRVTAIGLYLPFVIGNHVDLTGAVLREANLRSADFFNADLRHAQLEKVDLVNANLWKADLRNANLGHAFLRCAYLREAKLGDANLINTNLDNAYFRGTDLRGVKNLERSLYLESVNFINPIVTPKEAVIIGIALSGREPHIIED